MTIIHTYKLTSTYQSRQRVHIRALPVSFCEQRLVFFSLILRNSCTHHTHSHTHTNTHTITQSHNHTHAHTRKHEYTNLNKDIFSLSHTQTHTNFISKCINALFRWHFAFWTSSDETCTHHTHSITFNHTRKNTNIDT